MVLTSLNTKLTAVFHSVMAFLYLPSDWSHLQCNLPRDKALIVMLGMTFSVLGIMATGFIPVNATCH